MGIGDDAREAFAAAGERVKHEFGQAKDRLDDKSDEVRADAQVRHAEAEKESVEKRNEVKEALRD